jgi:predicted nucleic acid-binding protein
MNSARVLKSTIYEARFGEFAIIFADRQKELELALLVHTTLEMDSVGRTLANVDHKVRTLDEKLNIVLLFSRLRTPQEKAMLELVESKGGIEVCMADDAILEELILISREDTRDLGQPLNEEINETALRRLKQELNENVDESLQRNMLVFEKKLEDQKKDLVDAVEDTTHQEADRVISAVASGPHDDIVDPVRSTCASLDEVLMHYIYRCCSIFGRKWYAPSVTCAQTLITSSSQIRTSGLERQC